MAPTINSEQDARKIDNTDISIQLRIENLTF